MSAKRLPNDHSLIDWALECIRAAIHEQNVTQEELAQLLNMSKTGLNAVLAGKNEMKANDLLLMCRRLGIPLDGITGAHGSAGDTMEMMMRMHSVNMDDTQISYGKDAGFEARRTLLILKTVVPNALEELADEYVREERKMQKAGSSREVIASYTGDMIARMRRRMRRQEG